MVNFIYYLYLFGVAVGILSKKRKFLLKVIRKEFRHFGIMFKKIRQEIKTTPFVMGIHIHLNLLGEAMRMDIHNSSVSVKCKNNK